MQTKHTDLVAEFIAAYGLTPGEAVPQKGRLSFSIKHGVNYDAFTQLLEDAVEQGRLTKKGVDGYFVQ
ncbi:hypothetical protein ACCS68_14625 [Rhizobium beringeri]|uniref:hypothetical protein n=1 Tax=Rhizobium TaxID=379 RepID=UPI001030ECE0|nr:hypothetical protein [Rhizobium leguminosarum]TBH23618.1 hypothetical protein ELG64_08930 [Rhizobium leguminosarum]